MLNSFTSSSDDVDPFDAVAAIVEDCRQQARGYRPQIGLVFISYQGVEYREILQQIQSAFPETQLLGCTTDGEISSTLGFSEDSISLMLFASDTIRFATALATDISVTPEESFGKAFAECSMQLSQNPVCGFIFPDGLTSIGTPLDVIIRSTFGDSFPFFGGTAGDNYLLKKTYQFYGSAVHTDAAPVLMLGGKVKLTSRMVSGWTPIGSYHTVDAATNNRAYGIAGLTTQGFFEKYLGPYQQAFTDFPLALYHEEGDDFILRNSLGIDENDGSMDFVGNFFPGAKVRLTTVTRDDAISAADNANRDILEEIDFNADAMLIFSCAVRRHFLGSRTGEESRRLRDSSHIPIAGFHGYGEIGPIGAGRPTWFHNNTYLVVAIKAEE